MSAELKQEEEKQSELEVNEAEREEFRDAFKLFDKDGDGVITTEEIYEVFISLGFRQYTKKDIQKMVEAIDIDGNGTIDLDEFIVLLRQKKTGKYEKMTYEDELKQAFQIFDGDGSGEIDSNELSTIMNALGENLSKQDIEFMIKSIDIDSNGAIDFKEFKKMMQLAPIQQPNQQIQNK
eukprot:UN00555